MSFSCTFAQDARLFVVRSFTFELTSFFYTSYSVFYSVVKVRIVAYPFLKCEFQKWFTTSLLSIFRFQIGFWFVCTLVTTAIHHSSLWVITDRRFPLRTFPIVPLKGKLSTNCNYYILQFVTNSDRMFQCSELNADFIFRLFSGVLPISRLPLAPSVKFSLRLFRRRIYNTTYKNKSQVVQIFFRKY